PEIPPIGERRLASGRSAKRRFFRAPAFAGRLARECRSCQLLKGANQRSMLLTIFARWNIIGVGPALESSNYFACARFVHVETLGNFFEGVAFVSQLGDGPRFVSLLVDEAIKRFVKNGHGARRRQS